MDLKAFAGGAGNTILFGEYGFGGFVKRQRTKPVIAAVEGAALAGGFEMMLACDLVVAGQSAQFALPEVRIGLIPGAGGTVRLPRLIAAEDALRMIATGKPVGAAQALALGLVDAVLDGDLLAGATEFARRIVDAPLPLALSDREAIQPLDPAAWEALIAGIERKARGQTSPIMACEAVQNALRLPVAEAFAAERALFLKLKESPQSAALRHVFFAERAVSKLPMLKDRTPRPLSHIGVVGGGTMGAGIAAACLLAGLSVTMIERDSETCAEGQARVVKIIAESRARGLLDAAREDAVLSTFETATDYAVRADADLVIEEHDEGPTELTDLSLEALMDIDVEVTSASRKSQSLEDVAAAVYVITAEDIRRTGARSIPEALRLAFELGGAALEQVDTRAPLVDIARRVG